MTLLPARNKCKPRVEPHNYYWPERDLGTDHIKAKLFPRVLCRAVNTALNWMRVRSQSAKTQITQLT